MTREEYFKQLKMNIQSLSLDEQNEALQYYSDYFDDAGDDEKTMAELGSPEDVAKEIREKFSNALVKQGNNEKESNESEKTGNVYNDSEALFYSFEESAVKSLDFGFGAAEIALISGNKYTVETRGLSSDALDCRLTQNGTLTIKNLKKLEGLRFWGHERRRVVPRILITIPSDAKVESLRISLGAGKLIGKEIALSYDRGMLEVGAGNFVLGNIYGNHTDVRCGMGNMELCGKLTGKTNVDCGMGAVKLNLDQSETFCSYDAQVGLGNFKFNDFKKSGVGNCNVSKKENHFSVNVGMGDVSIKTK